MSSLASSPLHLSDSLATSLLHKENIIQYSVVELEAHVQFLSDNMDTYLLYSEIDTVVYRRATVLRIYPLRLPDSSATSLLYCNCEIDIVLLS